MVESGRVFDGHTTCSMSPMGTSSRQSPHLRRRLDAPRSSHWHLLAQACGRWQRRGAASSGAALAFHASSAFGCALLAALALAALALGPAGIAALPGGLSGAIGHDAANALSGWLLAASHPPHAALAAALGALGAVAAGAGGFAQLRRALNRLHDAPPAPTPAPAGFLLVLAAGGLLLASLVLGTAGWRAAAVHGVPPAIAGLADAGLGAVLLLPALAALLRWLPDAPPAGLSAWKGALAAGGPIVLGKVLLGAWLAGPGFVSAYGAAGALLLTMLWLYGAALLLLFGAALAAGIEARELDPRTRHAGARPLRATPERVAANTPLPAASPTSLAAARARLRPPLAARRPADERRPASAGVLLQFPAARRTGPPPS